MSVQVATSPPITLATTKPRVLVFAFACEPGRGSEPGAGWGVVRTLAEFAECVVLIGAEHTAGMQRWKEANPAAALTFHEVPDPRWAPPLARRGSLEWFVVYLDWLRRARALGERLHAERPFDLSVHATYSTYWLPPAMLSAAAPRIWGPVGGAVVAPVRLWPLLGMRGMVEELVHLVAVRAMALIPSTRRGWRRVSHALVQNRDTLRQLGSAVAGRAELLNHAMFVDVPAAAPLSGRPAGLLAAGRLESRKGLSIALRALAQTPLDVTLTIAGDGPQRRTLERLAKHLGIAERVHFIGVIPRARLMERMVNASALLFTGVREEGGLALAEAMLMGVPVIVLGHGGAGEIARAAIDPSRVHIVEPGGGRDTCSRLAQAMALACREPQLQRTPNLDREAARRRLHAVLREVLGVAPDPIAMASRT